MVDLYAPDEFRRGRTLSIRMFDLKTLPKYDAEPLEDLRVKLGKRMEKELRESGFFEAVALIPDDATANTDFLLTGEFRRVEGGSRGRRLAGVGGTAVLGLFMKLRAGPEYGRIVADFEALSHDSGGWLGVAGSKGATENNIEDISDWTRKQILLAEKKLIEYRGLKNPKPMEASLEGSGGNLLTGGVGKATGLVKSVPVKKLNPFGRKSPKKEQVEKTAEKKNAQPAAGQPASGEEIEAPDDDEAAEEMEDSDTEDDPDIDVSRKEQERRFMAQRVKASNGRRPRREVIAVWVTGDAYEGHRALQNMAGKPREAARAEKLLGGLVAAKTHFMELEKEPSYVFALSFYKTPFHGPIFWDAERLRSATFVKVGDRGARINPVAFIDSPAPAGQFAKGKLKVEFLTHTLLVGVRSVRPDGKPLISGGEDVLELHTEFDRRPVVLRFPVSKMQLRDLAELQLKARAVQAGK